MMTHHTEIWYFKLISFDKNGKKIIQSVPGCNVQNLTNSKSTLKVPLNTRSDIVPELLHEEQGISNVDIPPLNQSRKNLEEWREIQEPLILKG